MQGIITRVFLTRGFAFVKGDDGLAYFLQVDELRDAQWDGTTIRPGVRVEFAAATGKKGLRATEVRLL